MTTTARRVVVVVVVVLAVVVELMLGLVGGGLLRLSSVQLTSLGLVAATVSERKDTSKCVRRLRQNPRVEARADKARLVQTRCGRCGRVPSTKLGGQKKTRQAGQAEQAKAKATMRCSITQLFLT